MTAVAVTDAVLALLNLPPNTETDDTISEPAKVRPGFCYAWPRRLSPQKLEEANGRWSEADLRIRVLVTVASKGEPRAPARTRDLSVTLDDWVDQAHLDVAANRRHPYWWDLYIENVNYDAVRTFDSRGASIDLVARLILPLAVLTSGS